MANGTTLEADGERVTGRRSMVNLTKEQHEWARKTAFETNKSIAWVIRAAIDAAMKTGKTG
jgi:hypothetical protein